MKANVPETRDRCPSLSRGCRRAGCEASAASTGPPGRPRGSAALCPRRAASGAVARTFSCTVSSRAFFPGPSRGVFCGVSVGLQSLVMCLWCSVFAVCPWY